MKKIISNLLLAIIAIVLFQTCKPKENLTGKDETQTSNKQVAGNDTITKEQTNNTIAIENTGDKDDPKTGNKKNATVNNGLNDTIVPILTITETEYDEDPPVETMMTSPMPKIVTDLFPDIKWKLFVNNDGHNKYYSTKIGNSGYAYSRLNDLVALKYALGELSDNQLIELFIFLYMHPYDTEMKLLSTEYLEEVFYNHFNYKSIVVLNGEKIEFYSKVLDNRYKRCFAIKNNRIFKQLYIEPLRCRTSPLVWR